MSALRIPRRDGTVELVPIDDGAVARIHGGVGYTRQMGQYDLHPKLGQITPPSKLATRAANKARSKA